MTTITNSIKLELLGFVESGLDTLQVQLYNFSDSSVIHTATINSTTTNVVQTKLREISTKNKISGVPRSTVNYLLFSEF